MGICRREISALTVAVKANNIYYIPKNPRIPINDIYTPNRYIYSQHVPNIRCVVPNKRYINYIRILSQSQCTNSQKPYIYYIPISGRNPMKWRRRAQRPVVGGSRQEEVQGRRRGAAAADSRGARQEAGPKF